GRPGRPRRVATPPTWRAPYAGAPRSAAGIVTQGEDAARLLRLPGGSVAGRAARHDDRPVSTRADARGRVSRGERPCGHASTACGPWSWAHRVRCGPG